MFYVRGKKWGANESKFVLPANKSISINVLNIGGFAIENCKSESR